MGYGRRVTETGSRGQDNPPWRRKTRSLPGQTTPLAHTPGWATNAMAGRAPAATSPSSPWCCRVCRQAAYTVTPPPSHHRATQGGEDAGTPCCHQDGLFHDNQVGPLPPLSPNSSSFARAAGSATALGRRPPPRHHHRRAHGGHHDGHRHGHRTHHGVARCHDGRRLWLCRRLLGRVGLLAQHIVFARRPGGWLALGRRWAGSTVHGDANGRWAAATTRAATTHGDSRGWKSGGDVAGNREWGAGRDEQRMCGARRAEGMRGGASVCGVVDECIEGNTRLQRGSNAIDYPPRAHRARPAGVGWIAAAGTRKRAGREGNPTPRATGADAVRAGGGAARACWPGKGNTLGSPLSDTLLYQDDGRRASAVHGWRRRRPWAAHLADPPPPLQCFPRMGRRPPAGGRGGPLTPPGGPVGDVAHPAYPGKVASRGDPPALSKPPTASPVTKTGSNISPPRRHQLPLHDAER